MLGEKKNNKILRFDIWLQRIHALCMAHYNMQAWWCILRGANHAPFASWLYSYIMCALCTCINIVYNIRFSVQFTLTPQRKPDMDSEGIGRIYAPTHTHPHSHTLTNTAVMCCAFEIGCARAVYMREGVSCRMRCNKSVGTRRRCVCVCPLIR